MNLKNVRIFQNSLRQLSQTKVSPTLQKSAQTNGFTNHYLNNNESHDISTNNFLAMFEVDVKNHWGI